jgi:hypothetical protein
MALSRVPENTDRERTGKRMKMNEGDPLAQPG